MLLRSLMSIIVSILLVGCTAPVQQHITHPSEDYVVPYWNKSTTKYYGKQLFNNKTRKQ
jgi:hypothetical protein